MIALAVAAVVVIVVVAGLGVFRDIKVVVGACIGVCWLRLFIEIRHVKLQDSSEGPDQLVDFSDGDTNSSHKLQQIRSGHHTVAMKLCELQKTPNHMTAANETA